MWNSQPYGEDDSESFRMSEGFYFAVIQLKVVSACRRQYKVLVGMYSDNA